MPAPQLPFVLQAWIRTVLSGAAKILPVICVGEMVFVVEVGEGGAGWGVEVNDAGILVNTCQEVKLKGSAMGIKLI